MRRGAQSLTNKRTGRACKCQILNSIVKLAISHMEKQLEKAFPDPYSHLANGQQHTSQELFTSTLLKLKILMNQAALLLATMPSIQPKTPPSCC